VSIRRRDDRESKRDCDWVVWKSYLFGKFGVDDLGCAVEKGDWVVMIYFEGVWYNGWKLVGMKRSGCILWVGRGWGCE
jgi:hypothetical protein